MKIAVITLFCREWFRAEAWKRYYDGYRDEVYLHGVGNNGDAAATAALRDSLPGPMGKMTV